MGLINQIKNGFYQKVATKDASFIAKNLFNPPVVSNYLERNVPNRKEIGEELVKQIMKEIEGRDDAMSVSLLAKMKEVDLDNLSGNALDHLVSLACELETKNHAENIHAVLGDQAAIEAYLKKHDIPDFQSVIKALLTLMEEEDKDILIQYAGGMILAGDFSILWRKFEYKREQKQIQGWMSEKEELEENIALFEKERKYLENRIFESEKKLAEVSARLRHAGQLSTPIMEPEQPQEDAASLFIDETVHEKIEKEKEEEKPGNKQDQKEEIEAESEKGEEKRQQVENMDIKKEIAEELYGTKTEDLDADTMILNNFMS